MILIVSCQRDKSTVSDPVSGYNTGAVAPRLLRAETLSVTSNVAVQVRAWHIILTACLPAWSMKNIKHQQRVQSEANTRKLRITKEGEDFLELKRRQTQKTLSSIKILTIKYYNYLLVILHQNTHSTLYNLNISLILSRRCRMLVVETVSVWTCSMTLLQSLLVQIHADLSLEVAHQPDVSTTNIFY